MLQNQLLHRHLMALTDDEEAEGDDFEKEEGDETLNDEEEDEDDWNPDSLGDEEDEKNL